MKRQIVRTWLAEPAATALCANHRNDLAKAVPVVEDHPTTDLALRMVVSPPFPDLPNSSTTTSNANKTSIRNDITGNVRRNMEKKPDNELGKSTTRN